MRRAYVAGPMSGCVDFNRPKFHAESARLRSLGYHVGNPAENAPPACNTWEGWMRLGIAQLITCDTIVLLPGWERSRGAVIEHRIAEDLGMAVVLAGEVA